MEPLKWSTEKRKVNDLIPYEHNPRVMSEKQVEDLTSSLKKFGLVEIPAVDKDNKIIAGHQRLKILQLLGRGKTQTIIDPFCGQGSVLAIANAYGFNSIGVEILPNYCRKSSLLEVLTH